MARLPLYKPLPQGTHDWVMDLVRGITPRIGSGLREPYAIYCLLDPSHPTSRFSMTHYRVLTVHFGTRDMQKVAEAVSEYEFDYRLRPSWSGGQAEPPCHCPAWLLLDAWGGHRDGCLWYEWKKSKRLAQQAARITHEYNGGCEL